MAFFRVYADDSGATHLAPIDLPQVSGAPRRLGLRDIPATTITIGELLERKPDGGLHTPPRRQVVVVLRGELEVTTTSGDQQRFGPGDCLLADDLDSQGHTTRDVGSDRLRTLTVGITSDWEPPGLP
jgi:hypothetical protein